VGRLRGETHRYQVAIVAEGDLIFAFATVVVLIREGHGYHAKHN
jgi:hypothetical protein